MTPGTTRAPHPQSQGGALCCSGRLPHGGFSPDGWRGFARGVSMGGMTTMSADDRVFELVALTVSRQRRERYFTPEAPPPGSPSREQPDGGGTEQDPRRA